MKKQTTLVLILLTLVVLATLYLSRQKNEPHHDRDFQYGPFKWTHLDQKQDGHAAKLFGEVIMTQDLLAQSLALNENLLQQAQIILTALTRDPMTQVASPIPVTLNLPIPTKLGDLERMFPNFKIQFQSSPKDLHIAVVNSQAIGREQLKFDQVTFSVLQSQAFYLMIDLLSAKLTQKLILAEAKKSNMTYSDFVKAHITKGDVYVSDREIRNFIKDSGLAAKTADKGLTQRIASLLRDHKTKDHITNYIENHFPNQIVEYYFANPHYQMAVPEDVAFVQKDPNDSRNNIYIFSNLSCGPCRLHASKIFDIFKNHSKTFRILYVNSFQESDPVAQLLAEASTCLAFQNETFFWEFFRLANSAEKPFSETNINSLAKNTGADFDRYHQCLMNRESQAKVKKHLSVSRSLSISAQPTVIIGPHVFAASFGSEHLKSSLMQWSN